MIENEKQHEVEQVELLTSKRAMYFSSASPSNFHFPAASQFKPGIPILGTIFFQSMVRVVVLLIISLRWLYYVWVSLRLVYLLNAEHRAATTDRPRTTLTKPAACDKASSDITFMYLLMLTISFISRNRNSGTITSC